MLKEVLEVKVKGKTRRVHVRPFAWNLHAPTHMEWTPDGRLLVVERTTGKIKDATKGGDMEEVKPFAWGLEGPASMCPLPDGRILITEFWGGRIRDITKGGDVRSGEVVASGLKAPYSLAYDEQRRKLSLTVTDPANSTMRMDVLVDPETGDVQPLVTQIPPFPPHGFEGINPWWVWREGFGYDPFMLAGCNDWKKVNLVGESPYSTLLTTGDYLLGVPKVGGPFTFSDLLAKHCIATGLGFTGGMISPHHSPEIVLVTQPTQGSVKAVNVLEPGDYRFEPPLVTGLPMVSCVRMSQDDERMFACSIVGGVIWSIEGLPLDA